MFQQSPLKHPTRLSLVSHHFSRSYYLCTHRIWRKFNRHFYFLFNYLPILCHCAHCITLHTMKLHLHSEHVHRPPNNPTHIHTQGSHNKHGEVPPPLFSVPGAVGGQCLAQGHLAPLQPPVHAPYFVLAGTWASDPPVPNSSPFPLSHCHCVVCGNDL